MPNIYAPIHCHTSYSLLDSIIKISDLVQLAAKYGLPAIAQTEHGTLSGAVDFYSQCTKGGIKPIIGIEAYVATGSRFDKTVTKNQDPNTYGNYHLVLLAKDNEGYKNLCRLSSLSYKEGFSRKPRIDLDILREYNKGIIATSGCLGSQVNQQILSGDLDKARDTILWFREVFDGRYYIELQKNGESDQDLVNPVLAGFAEEYSLPTVAALDCHILDKSHSHTHEAFLCVQTGAKLSDEKKFYFNASELYVRSPEEMAIAFAEYPEAISNTLLLADQCNVSLEFGKHYMPRVDIIASTPEEELRKKVYEGIERKRSQLFSITQSYIDRVEMELKVICDLEFASYFLIVADMLDWARSNDIPIGSGRGSVGGSVCAWFLGITEVDSIQHDLIFERFLNKDRVSLCDIDMDFCQERRDEVLQYLKSKYGEEYVGQIATFGTMKGKQCIRDIGRVIGLSFSDTAKLVDLYPSPKHGKEWSLEEAFEISPDLKAAADGEYKKLFDMALTIEGAYRHGSKHAAGVVISPEPLIDLVPMMVQKGESVTQFQYSDLEKIGLVKFDLLGLKTLTFIDKVKKMIKKNRGIDIVFREDEISDPRVYDLLCSGKTRGCFQVETPGFQDLLVRAQPKNFDVISALLALYRPGPMSSSLHDVYVDRRNGTSPTEYAHEDLREILAPTSGVIIYQEQVMAISVKIAGFTESESDILRAVMGKKKVSEMPAQKEKFIAGAINNGYNIEFATTLFEQMEDYAFYCFNKSHSVSYSYITYRTAWLKAYYPLEFMTCLLNTEITDPDKTFENMAECRNLGLTITPPDINLSEGVFTSSKGKIIFGLNGIAGISDKTANEILSNRTGNIETITELFDLLKGRNLSKRVLDGLVKSGSLDCLGITRRGIYLSTEGWVKQYKKSPIDDLTIEDMSEWGLIEKLNYEKEVTGFYISGHPLDCTTYDLEHTVKIKDIPGSDLTGSFKIAGIPTNVEKKNTKTGKRYATMVIEDRDGSIQSIAWPEVWALNDETLISGIPCLFSGRMHAYAERTSFIIDSVEKLAIPTLTSGRIDIITTPKKLALKKTAEFPKYIDNHPGRHDVYIHIIDDEQAVTVYLGEKYRTQGFDENLLKLRKMFGATAVTIS